MTNGAACAHQRYLTSLNAAQTLSIDLRVPAPRGNHLVHRDYALGVFDVKVLHKLPLHDGDVFALLERLVKGPYNLLHSRNDIRKHQTWVEQLALKCFRSCRGAVSLVFSLVWLGQPKS